MSDYCVCCGSPLPSDHGHATCSMCYGDMDYGTDGYYRAMAEEQEREAREQEEAQRQDQEADHE